MRFSPLLVSNLIIWPLRYFFSNYAGTDLYYDSDPKASKIEIGVINDMNKEPNQVKPRILVNRGDFVVNKVGLSDNLAEAATMTSTKGIADEVKMVMINGMATILIEARAEGTVELIADMVSHFIIWTRPYICDSQGFKEFGLPLNISAPALSKEDKEIFQVNVSIPYIMEEHWKYNTDAIKIKDFIIATNFEQV